MTDIGMPNKFLQKRKQIKVLMLLQIFMDKLVNSNIPLPVSFLWIESSQRFHCLIYVIIERRLNLATLNIIEKLASWTVTTEDKS